MWNEGPVPDALTMYPGYLLARLGQSSQRRFHALVEPLGLHPRHFGMMNLIAAQPGISQQRLGELAGIDPSSMVAAVDELERMRLAERRRHPDDRRVWAIYLTDEGTRKLAEVRELAAQLQGDFFSPLSEEERRTLLELLRKLAEGQQTAGGP